MDIREYYKAKLMESLQQLDEVSPPGMKKMTHSKEARKSFEKQYPGRGKEVQYATAWKESKKEDLKENENMPAVAWHDQIRQNTLNLSPEKHQEALKLLKDAYKAKTLEYPGALNQISTHLIGSGIDKGHPIVKEIKAMVDDAEEMNRDKARSRAGL